MSLVKFNCAPLISLPAESIPGSAAVLHVMYTAIPNSLRTRGVCLAVQVPYISTFFDIRYTAVVVCSAVTRRWVRGAYIGEQQGCIWWGFFFRKGERAQSDDGRDSRL